MDRLDGWDIALLAAAGYWAVTALVRLMLAHRDAKIAEVKRQFADYQRQQEAAKKSSSETQAGEPTTPRRRSAA